MKSLQELITLFYLICNENKKIDLIPYIFSALAIILSLGGFLFNIFSFWFKDRKENKDAKKKLRLEWYKIFILNSNYHYCLDFFESIEKDISKLRSKKLTLKQKEIINESVVSNRQNIKKNLIDLLRAIDQDLHTEMLKQIDLLTDYLTESIFSGKNLQDPILYDEIINFISECKIKVIGILTKYEG